jgi:3-oxoacyl-[acyl-carrier protein] reductase
MFQDLKGRRVLITGSTLGIGLAAAEAFVRMGAKVGLNGRRVPADIDATLARLNTLGGEAAFFQADVGTEQGAAALVADFTKRFGGIDVLVNNAGGLVARKPLPEIDTAFFHDVLDVNALSAVMVTRAALPHLKDSAKGGQSSSVILVGSVAGDVGGGPGAALYGASKAFLHNIQKNWVNFHSADGIRFNTVAPGTIDTAFHADKSEEVKAKIGSGIPLGRLGRAEECAPSFLFLGSHACSGYMTGQILNVNGGQFMP